MENTTTSVPAAPQAGTNQVDTHSYKGWLNSDRFIKRALAVLGYSTIGQLVVFVPVYLVIVIIALVIVAVAR